MLRTVLDAAVRVWSASESGWAEAAGALGGSGRPRHEAQGADRHR